MTEELARLGAAFAATMAEYVTSKDHLSALQHEADRQAASAGIAYGSSVWSAYRFAATGPAVLRVNALYGALEDLTREIALCRPACLAGLLVKARAYQFAGNPEAIITEIEALAQTSNQEAA